MPPGDVFPWPAEAPDEPAPSAPPDPGGAPAFDDESALDSMPAPAADHPSPTPAPADPFADVLPVPETPAAPAHAAPGSGPVDATPAPVAPQMAEPAHASLAPEPTPAPAHAASPEMPPSPEAPVTAAGLVKRQRGASSIDESAGSGGDRTAPSKRSPDQVKNMLSRYKSGLQRGRDVTEGGGQ